MKAFHSLLLGLVTSLFLVAPVYAKEKIVVVDGSLTEIIYALNAGQNIAAVDTTSTYPRAATELPNIGYMRALSAEGILSIQPTMVIATDSAGPPNVLTHLKKTGINIQIIKNNYSIEGLYQKIDTVAALLQQNTSAKILKNSIEEKLAPTLKSIALQADHKPKVLVFLGMQGNQLMAAGKKTQADAVIDILGAANVAGNFHGYKPINKEAVLASDADAIIILSHLPSVSPQMIAEFSYTQAAKNNKVIVAPSNQLLGFGPRFPEALQKVSEALYSL